MKKTSLILASVLTLFLWSCNFTEDLFIEEDGSGKIAINFDGSELMQMGGGEQLNASTEKIDSIISFKELLELKKDSIAQLPEEEQRKLKKLENFKMHMIVDGENKDMKMNLFTNFKNVNELSDVFSAFQNAGAFSAKGENTPNKQVSVGDATEVSYSFNKNTFKRIGKVTNEELLQKSVDSLGSMEMFLSSSTYTLNYHFPRRVKSVSVKGALFSEDRKTVIYKVPFMDYMKNPEALNIEVVLENR